MPATAVYNTGDEQVILQWSEELTAHYFRNIHSMFQPHSGNPLVGMGEADKAIVYKQNLKKKKGKTITFTKLWDAAVEFRDATVALEGSETTAQDNTWQVTIGHIRGGTKWELLFDQQLVQHDVLEQQVWALGLSAAQVHYLRYLGHLMAYRGGTKASPVDVAPSADWTAFQGQQIDFSESQYFGGQKPTPADDDHHYRCGSLTLGTRITDDASANMKKLKAVDLTVISTRTSESDPPLIAPIMVNGKHYFPFLLDIAGIETLKEDSDFATMIHDFSIQGGDIAENAFFTGAIGRYRRLVFVEIEKSPPGLDQSAATTLSTVRRGVVLGANSLNIAMGQTNSPANMWFLVTGTRDGKQLRWWHAHSVSGCGCPEYTNVHDSTLRDHSRLVVSYQFTDFKSL